jgi:hypothetical protein
VSIPTLIEAGEISYLLFVTISQHDRTEGSNRGEGQKVRKRKTAKKQVRKIAQRKISQQAYVKPQHTIFKKEAFFYSVGVNTIGHILFVIVALRNWGPK